MATCVWDGCTEDVPLSIYSGGQTYQPAYCKPHRREKARQSALARFSDRGDRKFDSHGYVLLRTEDGWQPEHRLVMGESLGRALVSGEEVWHKNKNRADNRLENLELRSNIGLSLSDLVCPHCGRSYV